MAPEEYQIRAMIRTYLKDGEEDDEIIVSYLKSFIDQQGNNPYYFSDSDLYGIVRDEREKEAAKK
jgi:hypothetical protein